jgi:hypothetical protein
MATEIGACGAQTYRLEGSPPKRPGTAFQEEPSMRITKIALVLLGVAVFTLVFAAQAGAQTFNKRTTVTFSHPVEIPGRVLPAGTYTFTVLESMTARNILQIWNEDKTNLITTILAVPDYRLDPTGETVIEFRERPANAPQALRAWFYPGDQYGMEFVYPKERAIQLAEVTHEVIPAETSEPTATEEMRTVPLIAVTPEKKEEPVAKAIQTTPPETTEVAQALPTTASLLPLVMFLGLTSIGIAFGLRRLATHLG